MAADLNIYHMLVRDPAGYLVELQTFLDPRWDATALQR